MIKNVVYKCNLAWCLEVYNLFGIWEETIHKSSSVPKFLSWGIRHDCQKATGTESDQGSDVY